MPRQSEAATAILVLAPFPATRDSSCNRMRRSDRRIRAKAGRTQPHPVRGVAEQTVTGSAQRAGTGGPQETGACYVSRAGGIRSVSEDERKPQPPESNL